jgi:hypothetical protein
VSGRDLGASVRQRLLNQSRAQERPFQELLQYFAMERFLYRLSKSPSSDRFVLKGALLLTAWRAPQSRPTMDRLQRWMRKHIVTTWKGRPVPLGGAGDVVIVEPSLATAVIVT